MKKIITFSLYLSIACYLCYYCTFESLLLPNKIDTHIHYLRIENILESFRDFNFFPSWHSSPNWGYPEDYNYILTYLPIVLLSTLFGTAISIKTFYLLSFLFAAYSSRRLLKNFYNDEHLWLLGSILYMGAASFINFGIGAGSITRLIGISIFPIVVHSFIKWHQTPKTYQSFIFAILFYLSYLVHPIASLSVILTIILYIAVFDSKNSVEATLNDLFKIAGIGLPLFAWQIGSLLVSKNHISWDQIYAHYRQYLLSFDVHTFTGFWMNSQSKSSSFYFGFFPFILTLLAPIWWRENLVQKKNLVFGLTLTLITALLILSGTWVFKINLYRFDMVYVLGTAIVGSFALSLIKYRPLAIVLTLGFIAEQTWYARPFGGRDYVPESFVAEAKEKYPTPILQKRVLAQLETFWIISERDRLRSNLNWTFLYTGFLELTPASLGMLPFVFDIQDKRSLANFLGLMEMKPEKQLGVAASYKKHLIVEGVNQNSAFEKIYKKLLEHKDFKAEFMPLVFKSSLISYFKIYDSEGFEIDPNSSKWMAQVVDYFKDQKVEELETLSTSKDSLVIIKDAYHPRRKVESKDKLIATHLALPGLIALYPTEAEHVVQISEGFLWWEKVLGLISLSTLLSYLGLIFGQRRYNHLILND